MISVSYDCCVLLGRGLCVDRSLMQRRPTECACLEFDREASRMRRPWPTDGCCCVEGEKGNTMEFNK